MTLTTMTARSGGAATRDPQRRGLSASHAGAGLRTRHRLHVAVNLLGPGPSPDGLAATATEAPRGARG